jgi:5-methylcytosine-specific restriction protein A
MDKLKIGSHYNNDDICNTFLCAPQGGMRRSHKTNTLVIVANHTKSLYDDKWILDTMNYTGMGSKGDQSLDFAQNKTLAQSNENGVNVHFFEVFTDKIYTYQGQVVLIDKPFQESQNDEDGNNRNVWIFPLKRKDGSTPIVPKIELDKTLERKIKKASTLSLDELKTRSSKSPAKPGSRIATITTYQRDPNVVNYTLKRSNGLCELCKLPAPFKKKNGEPYLEVHHVKQLADGGDDTIENAVALCPNCHRRMHSLGLESDTKKLLTRTR